MAKNSGAYILIEGLKVPKKKPERSKIWDDASKKMYPELNVLRKAFPDYTYKDLHSSILTDDTLCDFLVKSLSNAKKSIYHLSDLIFSLHTGERLLPLTDMMRDEVDILSDEIKIRHCDFKDIPMSVMVRIIKHDLDLYNESEKLNKNLITLYTGFIKGKTLKKEILLKIRSQIRKLAILFKEREILINLHPTTLDRTFKKIQEEIRDKI